MGQRKPVRWVRSGDSIVSPDVRNTVALDSILHSWIGTRYMQGQSCKGVYADCVGFVAGVIDEWLGKASADKFPRHFYSGSDLLPLVQYCKSMWDYDESESLEVSPGDVLVGRFASRRLHIYIVGTVPNTVWHCIEGDGVCPSSIRAQTILKVYKPHG